MSNFSKNTEFLKPYLKLKQQECNIEKSVEALMVSSKSNLQYWNTIKQEVNASEDERKKLEESLKEPLRRIYEELKGVREVISPENIKTIDLEMFKKRLQDLWKKIQNFKDTCKPTADLAAEQATLETELNVLMRGIRKHKDFSNVRDPVYRVGNNKKPLTKSENWRKDDDDEREEDFTSLVARTGHTGTWTEDDHFLFVKLRKRHKSITSLAQAIQAKCPDLSNESIVNHDAWYRTYLDLRDKQRKAVQEWRRRKEAERVKLLEQRPKMMRVESAPDVTGNSSRENKKTNFSMELDRTEKVKVEDKKVDVTKKREIVKQWREQRDRTKIAEEERRKDQLKARQDEKENKWKARDAQLKKILAEIKEKKIEEKADSSESTPALPANLILQAYRAKDQEFIEKRKNILLSKRNTPKQCIPAMQYNFSKICVSTLLNETKAWQEKQRASEPQVTRSVNYIKDLPKRTMITWKSYEIPDSTLFRQRY
ncbi:coiled-coil domain-containing protein 112-like [Phymastichus coffea]|uniref:coiled-coil domain-containing protein 112-like n=1 Tax=Phymastichus coffea TaxID=108790 RepID=UPI00273C7ACE|nr:coiled-coil domain-containing protein 112-like [Phymastichus coffea]